MTQTLVNTETLPTPIHNNYVKNGTIDDILGIYHRPADSVYIVYFKYEKHLWESVRGEWRYRATSKGSK